MQVGVGVKYMHTTFGGRGIFGLGDIATFHIWPITVNPLSLSLPHSSLLLLLLFSSQIIITGSLVSLNDITISLQLHTDQQMTNTRTLY